MYVSDDGTADEHVFCRALLSSQIQLLPIVYVAISLVRCLVRTQERGAMDERTKCGHLNSSTASALSSLIFRYWSTLLSVPRI